MRIFKNRMFSKWAVKEQVFDQALKQAVEEIGEGLVEANLGGNLYKKRVAVGGRGKSGGVRTLLAFKVDAHAFFIYGFAKNARSNIREGEERALKKYVAELQGYSDEQLSKAVEAGALIEIESDG